MLFDEWPGSQWCAISFDFREWAEVRDFNIPSYNQLEEHLHSKIQYFMYEISKEEEFEKVLTEFLLSQNWSNPFISYTLMSH